VRDQLRDRLLTTPGVADIVMGGYVEPNLRVWLDQGRLNRYALTAGDVIQAIKAEHAEPPSGRIEDPRNEFNVRTMGEATDPVEFGKIVINRRGGTPNFNPISINQVARVEEGLADIRRISRANGKPAIGLGIRKQRGTNSVEVAKSVKAKVAALAPNLPKGIEIGVNFDTTKFIEDSVEELNFTLILSALLTAIVCWLFLGSWSATFNVILAIPTSIIGSFMLLKAAGFTLNTFTLLGLSLAIGIVVDDAIMVLENIVRHKEEGKSRWDAALIGSREIGFAAVAATVAIIAIFLPVAFMKGLIGRYFLQFGVTISIAVALSLLEALTLTPMRCSQFLEVSPRTSWLGRAIEGGFERCEAIYRRIIPFLLRHRIKTIAAAVLFCIGTFAINGLLKKEFVPPQDQGNLLLRLKAPEGSSLEFTNARMAEVEQVIAKRPETQRYFGSVGGFGGGDVNTATLFVTLKPFDQRGKDPKKGRPLTQQELAQVLRGELKPIKNLSVFVQDLSLAGFSAKRGYPVEFNIRGPDWAKLTEFGQRIKQEMEKSGLMTDVDSDFRGNVEELHIVPDRDAAKARAVGVADIGDTLSALLGGTVAGKFAEGGHRTDIRVKLENRKPVTSEDLRAIMIRNNRGELVPLLDVVKIQRTPSLQQISRQDRERAVSLFANVAPGKSQAEALQAVQRIGHEVLPQGYRLVVGGSAQTFKESFDSLIVALVLGLIVSYMVLASQFNSFVDPVTVLVALPFSVSGAFIALYLGGQTLNIYSMIGLILLMGIVKKNSIMLVDFTNQKRAEGRGVYDALVEACPIRLRPILMTSFATIAGAIPPAIAIGPGAESRVPMALAVLGGVLVSTLLTLFVVPCVYSLFARERKLATDHGALVPSGHQLQGAE
jgi:HAE1 family hydrophobic/amphiphilic exporter-1